MSKTIECSEDVSQRWIEYHGAETARSMIRGRLLMQLFAHDGPLVQHLIEGRQPYHISVEFEDAEVTGFGNVLCLVRAIVKDEEGTPVDQLSAAGSCYVFDASQWRCL